MLRIYRLIIFWGALALMGCGKFDVVSDSLEASGGNGAQGAVADGIWLTKTAKIDPTSLPLTDKKYVTDGPQAGSVFTCDPKMFQMTEVIGATVVGEWVRTSTFDVTKKAYVHGSVAHNGQFAISTVGENRVFQGNGLPVGVTTGVFPVQTSDPAYRYDKNPNSFIEQTISFSVPRNPTVAQSPSCTGLEIGITLDGVELSGPLDSSGRDEIAYEVQDACGGVTQPGGLYHRHALSDCMPHIHEKNALVGYSLDGFGIFSPFDENGIELTSRDLDECHGTTSEILWEGKRVQMYHYVLTRDYPYSISCFRGTPVAKSFPPLPPPPVGPTTEVTCTTQTSSPMDSQALLEIAKLSQAQCQDQLSKVDSFHQETKGLTDAESRAHFVELTKGLNPPPPYPPAECSVPYVAIQKCAKGIK